MTCRPTLAA